MSVPNQRIVIVHREKCEGSFLQIKKENWYAANKDLEPYGLQLYLYIAGNKEGFNLELSQAAAERDAGIKKTSFHKYVNVMIEKGYLVPKSEGSNVYDFYEVPQNIKNKVAVPSCELTCLQGENIENSDDGINSLSDEQENLSRVLEMLLDEQNSSPSDKEIYNKTNNTDKNINISKLKTFVF